jgi:hypothetical protein
MPVLNPIEYYSRAASADAPGLIAEALHDACAAHYDAVRHAFHYARFAGSPEFAALRVAARALADFDCAALAIGERLAFWLNVYNALVLHAVVARPAAAGVRALADFFSASQYMVGGYVFSLDEIEHGLLRVNAPRPGFGARPLRSDDARAALAPYMFDERVHFAMYSACRSSPAPAAYATGRFGEALERAARAYLARHVRGGEGCTLVVPKVLDWYAADFGGGRGALEFVVARLERDAEVELVDRCGARLKLRYAEFDWTLNAA